MRLFLAAYLIAVSSVVVAQDQSKPLASGDPATKADLDKRLADARTALLRAEMAVRSAKIELYRLGGIPNGLVKRLTPKGFTIYTVPNPNPKGKPLQKAEPQFGEEDFGNVHGEGEVTQIIKGVGARVTVRLPGSQDAARQDQYTSCDLILSGEAVDRMVLGDKVKFDGVYEVISLSAVEGFKNKLPVVNLVERYKLPR